jgi:hypothetical protein
MPKQQDHLTHGVARPKPPQLARRLSLVERERYLPGGGEQDQGEVRERSETEIRDRSE